METRILNLKLECNGRTLLIGNNEPIKIKSIDGLEAGDFQISSINNAMSDGSTVTGKKISQRNIDVAIETDNVDDPSYYREMFIKFFNPKYSGKLTVNFLGVERWINYEIVSMEIPLKNLFEDIECSFSLVCNEPYFSDMSDFGKNIASITPHFAFPLAISPKKIMGYRTLKQDVLLTNNGDVDTGLIMQFIAKRGPVKNPTLIKKSTNEFMRIITDLNKGDVLLVNTNTRQKNITVNGTRINHKIDRQSTYFSIDVGDNVLRYDADENYTNLDVRLYYTPKYLGV